MATELMRRDWAADLSRVEWGAVWNWSLTFVLIAFLGLEGGGFDPLVYNQVGIAAWWAVLALVLAGALPRRRIGRLALASLILLGAFALWTGLSLIWTESGEQTFVELGRVLTYVGIFALALGSRGRDESQRQLGAVAAGIVLVAGVGLLSRLHPGWFENADQTGRLLDASERLSYPLHYWNALGALTAIGIPLLLQSAAGARTMLARGLSAALVPALALTIFFTLSRGAILGAAAGTVIFLALSSDRLQKLPTLAIGALASGLLIALANRQDDLVEGFSNAAARSQGDEILLLGVVICAVAGAAQVAVALGGRQVQRPRWLRPRMRESTLAFAGALLAVFVVALALGAPGKAADAWDEFKFGEGPGEGTGRLSSTSGQERYEFWVSAVDQNATDPAIGTGAGTFQFWWSREGAGGETVRDAHSLYMQTLGELGIVGLVLLLAFLAVVLIGGARNALLAEGAERARLAAALAACSIFFLTAAIDWMWQMPVLPVAMLLLATILVLPGDRGARKPRLPFALRGGFAALALVAIAFVAIPLATVSLVRDSEAAARGGDFDAALADARSAVNVQPAAAGPRLQEALVLELMGDFGAAEAATREAIARERTNWRIWLVLSRVAARNGRVDASVNAYERARSLNPNSDLFQR
jgi:hypothetical protein